MCKMSFRINIVHGSQFVNEADKTRALEAAEQALKAGKSFEEAQSAADIALTNGWHDPNGAYCELIQT